MFKRQTNRRCNERILPCEPWAWNLVQHGWWCIRAQRYGAPIWFSTAHRLTAVALWVVTLCSESLPPCGVAQGAVIAPLPFVRQSTADRPQSGRAAVLTQRELNRCKWFTAKRNIQPVTNSSVFAGERWLMDCKLTRCTRVINDVNCFSAAHCSVLLHNYRVLHVTK